MDDRDLTVLFILVFFGIVVAGIGCSVSATSTAIGNCIKANNDWTVQQAHDYCNSVIREGKRP